MIIIIRKFASFEGYSRNRAEFILSDSVGIINYHITDFISALYYHK